MTWFWFWFIHVLINGLNITPHHQTKPKYPKAKKVKEDFKVVHRALRGELLLGIQTVHVVGQQVPSKHGDLHSRECSCIERFKLRVFRCTNLLTHEIIA